MGLFSKPQKRKWGDMDHIGHACTRYGLYITTDLTIKDYRTPTVVGTVYFTVRTALLTVQGGSHHAPLARQWALSSGTSPRARQMAHDTAQNFLAWSTHVVVPKNCLRVRQDPDKG